MEKSENATKTENQQKFDNQFKDLKNILRQDRPITFNLSSQVIEVEGIPVPYDITKESEIRRLLEDNGVKILTDKAYREKILDCDDDEEREEVYQNFICESQVPMIMMEIEEIRIEMLALFEEIHPSYRETSRPSMRGIGAENGPNPFTFSSIGAQRFISDHEKHLMKMVRNPRSGYVQSIPQPYASDKEKLTPKGKKLLGRMAAARIAKNQTLQSLHSRIEAKAKDRQRLKEAALLSGIPNPDVEKLAAEIKGLQKEMNECSRANLFAVDWMIMQLDDELSIKDGNITIRQSAQNWIAQDQPVQLGENGEKKTPREWLEDDTTPITYIINGTRVTKTIKEWITNKTIEHEEQARKIRQILHVDKKVTIGLQGRIPDWLVLDGTTKVAFNGSPIFKTYNEWALDPNTPQDILDWLKGGPRTIPFTLSNTANKFYELDPTFPALLTEFDEEVSSHRIRRRLAEKSSKDFNDKIRNVNCEPVSSWKFWQEEKARDLTAQEQQEGFTLGSLFFYGMGDQARIANIAYHNDHKMRVARDSEAENNLIKRATELYAANDSSVVAFSVAIDEEGISIEDAFKELSKL